MRVVVAGALVEDGRLLVAQRTRPPDLAGRWELPGGKVEDGETETEALVRELREELRIDVQVRERVGDDVVLAADLVLRAYRVRRTGGRATAVEHRAVAWVSGADLASLNWVEADRAWLPQLRELAR